MAHEYHTGVCSTGNWWDSSRNRLDTGSSPPSSSNIGSFGWPAEGRSSMDSVSVSGSSVVFHDTQKQLQGPDSGAGTDGSDGGVLGADPNLQLMGLGLPCQAMDWNQALLRSGKAENSFRSMLQEDMGSSGNIFSLDNQPQFDSHSSPSGAESTVTCQGLQIDSGVYGNPIMLQGLMGSDHNQGQQPSFENNRLMAYNNSYHANNNNNNFNMSSSSSSHEVLPAWSKFPQFLRASSSPKQPSNSQLHFSNNAPYWNASAAMNNPRSGFFPQMNPTPSFEEKPPKISTVEVSDSGTVGKKNGGEQGNKRPRSESASALPAFKVRKEKMGDRITALQQLVSPFGKTDTASVLSEAIEYIKFLHQQVSVLSTPYMNNTGAPIQHQQASDQTKDPEALKQDLRSRGLCLVPVSSTFPVIQETTVDFWTPTFGGTFR